MKSPIDKPRLRRRVRHRVRREISGNAKRPRLAVFRSNRHIYAQVIDDEGGATLTQASTLDKELRGKVARGTTIDAAKAVGELLGARLKSAGVETVVFDRGGYRYHGRVQAVAEGARSAGIKF